ncbi:MAG: AAA family ATPase [Candidatus Latescibacterota bacterium]
MSYTIAVAGKGGSGKTTLCALTLYHLLKTGKTPVLAVDADPNANLNEALGVTFDKTVVSTVDRFMDGKEQMPAGVPRDRYLEYQVQDAIVEASGYDLLVMGHTEGPGCYCHANDMLKAYLEKLVVNYPYIVMDNEAGMEHVSRRTTHDVDVLLIAANPTSVALRSAKRIYEMATQLSVVIGKAYLVINDLNRTAESVPEIMIEEMGLPLLGSVPYDEAVIRRSIDGTPLTELPEDSPAVVSVAKMMATLGL